MVTYKGCKSERHTITSMQVEDEARNELTNGSWNGTFRAVYVYPGQDLINVSPQDYNNNNNNNNCLDSLLMCVLKAGFNLIVTFKLGT